MQSEEKASRKHLASECIVIDDDSNTDPYKASKRSRKRKKSHHSKHKREVKVGRFENTETLVITQKVEVEKQKFKCIINLTNICEHKGNEKLKYKERPTQGSSERIVPQCLRKCSRQENAKRRSKQESSRHAKKKSTKPKHELRSLSSISLSSLKTYSELSYEDISSDSFSSIPSEDDIETLIKRTKDRDRRLRKPMLSDISDVETAILRSSDKDSLHSTATLVIPPQPEIYSPTKPTTSPDNHFYLDIMNNSNNNNNYYCHRTSYEENNYEVQSRREQYLPVLTNDEVYSENKWAKISLEDYHYNCSIKNEPYSPSEEPICDQQSLPYEVQIKFEGTEMDDVIDKTENLKKSLDMNIEGNPKIKVEGGLDSPLNIFYSMPRNDQVSLTNKSNRNDRHPKVKVENDVNSYVCIKSETTEIDY